MSQTCACIFGGRVKGGQGRGGQPSQTHFYAAATVFKLQLATFLSLGFCSRTRASNYFLCVQDCWSLNIVFGFDVLFLVCIAHYLINFMNDWINKTFFWINFFIKFFFKCVGPFEFNINILSMKKNQFELIYHESFSYKK